MSREIEVERQISPQRRQQLGADGWPTWSKEVSRFPWFYDDPETCLLLAGEVTVTPQGGTPVTLRAGDLARFPAGMQCTWDVTVELRKHYRFG